MNTRSHAENKIGAGRSLLPIKDQRAISIAAIPSVLMAMAMIASSSKPASILGIMILAWLSNAVGKQQQVAWSQRIRAFANGQRGDGQIGVATSSIMRCGVLSRRIAIMWKFTLPIVLMVIATFELGILLAPSEQKPEFTDLKIIFLLILLVCGARDFIWRKKLQAAFASLERSSTSAA
ncbi:MAG: hypothetical protein JSS25_05280 [Proteobacteria bacterium]|nr:hypothetical protein [Pseudomonadota bacterium]